VGGARGRRYFLRWRIPAGRRVRGFRDEHVIMFQPGPHREVMERSGECLVRHTANDITSSPAASRRRLDLKGSGMTCIPRARLRLVAVTSPRRACSRVMRILLAPRGRLDDVASLRTAATSNKEGEMPSPDGALAAAPSTRDPRGRSSASHGLLLQSIGSPTRSPTADGCRRLRGSANQQRRLVRMLATSRRA